MNIWELTRTGVDSLPAVESNTSFRKKYFTLVVFGSRKQADSGYAPMTIVLVDKKGVQGKMEFHPDSISFEHREGVTWHCDCLPTSMGMQFWATGNNEILDLKVYGAGTLYVEAV